MFYRKLALVLFALYICFPFQRLKADTPFGPGTNEDGGLAYALSEYTDAQGALRDEWIDLEILAIQQAMLGVQWDDNNEDMVDNAIDLGNAISVNSY